MLSRLWYEHHSERERRRVYFWAGSGSTEYCGACHGVWLLVYARLQCVTIYERASEQQHTCLRLNILPLPALSVSRCATRMMRGIIMSRRTQRVMARRRRDGYQLTGDCGWTSSGPHVPPPGGHGPLSCSLRTQSQKSDASKVFKRV
jgi:hypothetical protein